MRIPTIAEDLIIQRFRLEVCRRGRAIDSSEDLDWFSLSIGFFIACGIKPARAYDLATHVRYDKQYWHRPQAPTKVNTP